MDTATHIYECHYPALFCLSVMTRDKWAVDFSIGRENEQGTRFVLPRACAAALAQQLQDWLDSTNPVVAERKVK